MNHSYDICMYIFKVSVYGINVITHYVFVEWIFSMDLLWFILFVNETPC